MELDLAEEDAFHVFWTKYFDEWENAFTEMVVKYYSSYVRFIINIRCNILIPRTTPPFIKDKEYDNNIVIHMGRDYWREFVEGASSFMLDVLIKSRFNILEKRKNLLVTVGRCDNNHNMSEICMFMNLHPKIV